MHIERRRFLAVATGLACSALPTAALAGAGAGRRHTMVASWYGEEFAGVPMANGEPFDPDNSRIAAHRTLPFGTHLELENVGNGRIHRVVIEDRGPFKEGRDIDLSRAAAEKLGFVDDGVAVLSVRIIT